MAYRARVDPNVCIGATQCVETSPGTYRMNAAHTASEVADPRAPLEALLAGARACPVEAIEVVDEDTGERMFP